MDERAFGPEETAEILAALAEQLADAGDSFELVVIGGPPIRCRPL
jgi:hypothetical protein